MYHIIAETAAMEDEDSDFGFEPGGDSNTPSLSCAARSMRTALNETSLSAHILLILRVVHVVYISTMMLAGVLLNIPVVAVILWFKKLRTKSLCFAAQISAANLGWITFFGIPAIVQHGFGRQMFSIEFCITCGYFMHMLMEVRILLVFLFSIVKWTSILFPCLNPKRNVWVAVSISVLAWMSSIVGIGIGIPPILDCFSYSKATYSCPILSSCSEECFFYSLGYFVVVILLCVIAASLYYCIRKSDPDLDLAGRSGRSSISEEDLRVLKTMAEIAVSTVIMVSLVMVLMTVSRQGGSISNYLVSLGITDLLLPFVISDPFMIMKNPDIFEAVKTLAKSLKGLFQKA